MRRRTILIASASGVGLSGSIPRSSGEPSVGNASTTTPDAPDAATSTATDEDLPVVDNAGADDETIVVDVLVTNEEDEPVSGVTVGLEDRGGTPDDRFGETGPNGRIRFLESVGPPPCNTQTLKLPEHGVASDLGCNDGGAVIDRSFTIGSGRSPPTVTGTATPDDGWMDGWTLLASTFVGVSLVGPLVLGTLVAVTARVPSGDEPSTEGGDGD